MEKETQSLFREEAINANKNKLVGEAAIYSPPYRWVIISLVGLITFFIVLFLFTGTYTKHERVVGHLIPVGGVINIVTPVSGTVIASNIQEGQLVNSGQELMSISSEIATEEFSGARHLITEQHRIQRVKLTEDIEDLGVLETETLRGLSIMAVVLDKRLKQLDIQIVQHSKQLSLANRQLTKLQTMSKQGYSSNSQVDQQEALKIDADSRLNEVILQRLGVEQELVNIRQQIKEQPLNFRYRKNELKRKLSEVEQALIENESRKEVILTAPKPSLVATTLINDGQFVNAGQRVISLIPENGRLEARLMVPSRAIGFVRVGQRVVLRYDAYPYQKFGQQYGHVTKISRTALSPQEVSILIGNANVQEQHYRITVELDTQVISAYGKEEMLRPDMSLEADIRLENRRLIEWVLDPLYALGRRIKA